MGANEIRVGTCGFCMRQAEYYRTFPLIELQKPFYQPPQLATAERWRREAPEGFEFTLKAFQAITHPPNSPTYRRSNLSREQRREAGRFRDTATVRDAWARTFELARILEATRVIFQCPASFRPTDENLANLRGFFGRIERGGLRLGFEPRGEAWRDDLIAELCAELSLIHVVDPFDRAPATPPEASTPRYFRLHGVGGYHYTYSDDELRRLREMCDAPRTYCMFNNDAMRDDAQRFRALLDTASKSA